MSSVLPEPAESNQRYDVFARACPARELHDRISSKWVSLVMNALSDDERRFSDLSRCIAGVSQKMLTQTLRTLERDGLISRSVITSRPLQVSYGLTPLGKSLLPVFRAIKQWAEAHIEEVYESRADFEEQYG